MGRVYNVVINGFPQSGKDTFVQCCKDCLTLKIITCHSSVDKVKEAAAILGWSGKKDEKDRLFLQRLKELSDSFYDSSFKYMSNILKNQITFIEKYDIQNVHVNFFMIREPEKIKRFVEEIPNSSTLFISREVDKMFENPSDLDVFNFSYDCTICNDGTIEDLKIIAGKYLERFV